MKRRTFLKGAAVGGAAVGIGFDMSKARAEMRQFKIARTTETRSICPYCAIYLGTAAEPGTFRAMTGGTVTTDWARLHHPRWYKEVTGEQARGPARRS